MPVGCPPRTRAGWTVAAEASAVPPTAIAKPAANTAARWTRLKRMMSLLVGAVARQHPVQWFAIQVTRRWPCTEQQMTPCRPQPDVEAIPTRYPGNNLVASGGKPAQSESWRRLA